MATERFEVEEGVEYLVFTPDEATVPELHEGPWHFEPVGYGSGEVFSEGYPTKEAAMQAAKEWHAEDKFRQENPEI